MRNRRQVMLPALAALGMVAAGLSMGLVVHLEAKEKIPPVGPDDPTYRLYQLLDNSYAGKIDQYLIADTVKDPQNPDLQHQHILRVEYDKGRAFGKLRIYVRTVDKLTPEQLKTYTPKQIYDYAEDDSEKFSKTDPGQLGRLGDIYFRASEGRPLASAPITEELRKEYDTFLTQYILPGLEKK
jgi:hypothetical protein